MNEPTNSGELPQRSSRLTPEEVEQLRDMEWAMRDPDVQKKYPDEFAAVYRRQVIAHGGDEGVVLAEASRITGKPIHQIAITTILGPGILFGPRG